MASDLPENMIRSESPIIKVESQLTENIKKETQESEVLGNFIKTETYISEMTKEYVQESNTIPTTYPTTDSSDEDAVAPKRARRSFDVDFKLKAVEYAKGTTNKMASRVFGVDEKRIRDWCTRAEKLKDQSIKDSSSKRLPGAGRKVCHSIDGKLLSWIGSMQKNTPWLLTKKSIKEKAMEIFKSSDHDEDATFSASYGWLHCFLQRNNIKLTSSWRDKPPIKSDVVSASLPKLTVDLSKERSIFKPPTLPPGEKVKYVLLRYVSEPTNLPVNSSQKGHNVIGSDRPDSQNKNRNLSHEKQNRKPKTSYTPDMDDNIILKGVGLLEFLIRNETQKDNSDETSTVISETDAKEERMVNNDNSTKKSAPEATDVKTTLDSTCNLMESGACAFSDDYSLQHLNQNIQHLNDNQLLDQSVKTSQTMEQIIHTDNPNLVSTFRGSNALLRELIKRLPLEDLNISNDELQQLRRWKDDYVHISRYADIVLKHLRNRSNNNIKTIKEILISIINKTMEIIEGLVNNYPKYLVTRSGEPDLQTKTKMKIQEHKHKEPKISELLRSSFKKYKDKMRARDKSPEVKARAVLPLLKKVNDIEKKKPKNNKFISSMLNMKQSSENSTTPLETAGFIGAPSNVMNIEILQTSLQNVGTNSTGRQQIIIINNPNKASSNLPMGGVIQDTLNTETLQQNRMLTANASSMMPQANLGDTATPTPVDFPLSFQKPITLILAGEKFKQVIPQPSGTSGNTPQQTFLQDSEANVSKLEPAEEPTQSVYYLQGLPDMQNLQMSSQHAEQPILPYVISELNQNIQQINPIIQKPNEQVLLNQQNIKKPSLQTGQGNIQTITLHDLVQKPNSSSHNNLESLPNTGLTDDRQSLTQVKQEDELSGLKLGEQKPQREPIFCKPPLQPSASQLLQDAINRFKAEQAAKEQAMTSLSVSTSEAQENETKYASILNERNTELKDTQRDIHSTVNETKQGPYMVNLYKHVTVNQDLKIKEEESTEGDNVHHEETIQEDTDCELEKMGIIIEEVYSTDDDNDEDDNISVKSELD